MNNNGSLSLEILLTFMVFIIIMSSVLAMVAEEFSVLEETHTRRQAKEVTMQLSHTINTVALMGTDYSQEYHTPGLINNESYILQINSSGVYVNSHYQLTKDDIWVKTLFFNDKNIKNIILMPDHTYTFINKNGEVYIYG